jgi:hypothetical protein
LYPRCCGAVSPICAIVRRRFGFTPILDRHDIKPGEPWEARLGGLIEQSDTVVFVVSPEAVKSERCDWEIDKTLALSKRLLPVIHKPLDRKIAPQIERTAIHPLRYRARHDAAAARIG